MGLWTTIFGKKSNLHDPDLTQLAGELKKIDQFIQQKKLTLEISLKASGFSLFPKIQKKLAEADPLTKTRYQLKLRAELMPNFQQLLNLGQQLLIRNFEDYNQDKSSSGKLRLDVKDKEIIELWEILEEAQEKRDKLWLSWMAVQKSEHGYSAYATNKMQQRLSAIAEEIISALELRFRIYLQAYNQYRQEKILSSSKKKVQEAKKQITAEVKKLYPTSTKQSYGVVKLFKSKAELQLEHKEELKREMVRKKAA